jgi:hypothetical protein
MGKELMVWKPSEGMQRVLEAALSPSTGNVIAEWCKKAEVNPAMWQKWKRSEKFIEWWNREWARGMKDAMVYLDKIGLENAKTDFRYWEAMQKKYGGYLGESKGGGTNIIFNIPRPPERQVIDGEDTIQV